jgi:toxin FitB
LLDTNIVSELMKPDPSPWVMNWVNENEGECALSVMVIAEIADGIESMAEGKRKNALRRKLDFLQEDYADQVLVFDEACAWEWARYCNETRAAGGEPSVIDSQIAATARAFGLVVVTRNTKDFPLMRVIDPFQGK